MTRLVFQIALSTLVLLPSAAGICIDSQTYDAAAWKDFTIVCPNVTAQECLPSNCGCCCHGLADIPGICSRGGPMTPPKDDSTPSPAPSPAPSPRPSPAPSSTTSSAPSSTTSPATSPGSPDPTSAPGTVASASGIEACTLPVGLGLAASTLAWWH
eukprot:TRINITY_DN36986_c0_g1_i1.p1 TRINITY_DN36986_c0_g1~~TRINITY_DN36986_c0_g1_i1.p1  ORF type:complete len:167 (+),score=24.22 TRINITY_DN36986_c0_g1_i1:35-502(+)